MRRFLTNISRFGIFVEKIVCFTRFFSVPHWYISSRQKIKIGANIIYISLKKMISPFISGYNLVENPLIFTTKLLIVFYVTMNIKWMVRTKKWNGIDSTQLLGLRDRTYEQQKNSDSWKLKENWKRFLQTKKLQNDWEVFWIYSVSLWSLLWWLPRLLKSKDKLSRWRGFLNLRIDEYFSILRLLSKMKKYRYFWTSKLQKTSETSDGSHSRKNRQSLKSTY